MPFLSKRSVEGSVRQCVVSVFAAGISPLLLPSLFCNENSTVRLVAGITSSGLDSFQRSARQIEHGTDRAFYDPGTAVLHDNASAARFAQQCSQAENADAEQQRDGHYDQLETVKQLKHDDCRQHG